jgi:protein gp37
MREIDVRDMHDTPTGHVDHGPGPRAVQQSPTAWLPGENDLFHARVPTAFIAEVFAVMVAADRHTYQVLTKRPGRMARLLASDAFPELVFQLAAHRHGVTTMTWPLPNLWLGVSIEQDRYCWRAGRLRQTPAVVRCLSCEPLLGPLPSLDLTGIDWVICGGESGPDARAMQPAWARQLRDQATAAGVAFFFKQWGGRTPKAGGRTLDGRTWDQYPPRSAGAAPDHRDSAR